MELDWNQIGHFVHQWLKEDVGAGDFSSLASIDTSTQAESKLILKADGVVAGLELAKFVFAQIDEAIIFEPLVQDGTFHESGTILANASGSAHGLLKGERLMLNLLQRLSGVATQTHTIVKLVEGTGLKILDTRKTTPGLRMLEKWAVVMGGGMNHRMGLYDMIMLKDNHLDSAGGISVAVKRTKQFLKEHNLDLKIEVETRNLDEVQQALDAGVDRIMFDNFTPELCRQGVTLVENRCETEASGGISASNIRQYAETGVNFISIGSLTHSVTALDISFKTKLKAQ